MTSTARSRPRLLAVLVDDGPPSLADDAPEPWEPRVGAGRRREGAGPRRGPAGAPRRPPRPPSDLRERRRGRRRVRTGWSWRGGGAGGGRGGGGEGRRVVGGVLWIWGERRREVAWEREERERVTGAWVRGSVSFLLSLPHFPCVGGCVGAFVFLLNDSWSLDLDQGLDRWLICGSWFPLF